MDVNLIILSIHLILLIIGSVIYAMNTIFRRDDYESYRYVKVIKKDIDGNITKIYWYIIYDVYFFKHIKHTFKFRDNDSGAYKFEDKKYLTSLFKEQTSTSETIYENN